MLRRRRKSAPHNFCTKFRRKSKRRPRGSKRATPGAPKKSLRSRLRNPDASQLVTFARATRRVTSFFSSLKFLQNLACLLLFVSIAGCGSRRVTASPQPAPTQPTDASPETMESTRRATDAAPPATPAPSPAPKRSKPAQSPAPAGYMEEGNASWYGVPFNGRRASNGEIYDMYKLTAAHKTLPFETMVRVTNLNNGKSAVVRITDRGPFVDNRILDLSLAAAREIESVGPGVVPIRLEVLGKIDPTAGFFTVQVGAFRDRANAERLRDRLSASYSPVFIQQLDSPNGMY